MKFNLGPLVQKIQITNKCITFKMARDEVPWPRSFFLISVIFLYSDFSCTDSHCYIKYANKFISEDARLKELEEGFLNSSIILVGGGGTQKNWGLVYYPLPKTCTLLWPKYVVFLALFISWPKVWYPIYDHCGFTSRHFIFALTFWNYNISIKKDKKKIATEQLKMTLAFNN